MSSGTGNSISRPALEHPGAGALPRQEEPARRPPISWRTHEPPQPSRPNVGFFRVARQRAAESAPWPGLPGTSASFRVRIGRALGPWKGVTSEHRSDVAAASDASEGSVKWLADAEGQLDECAGIAAEEGLHPPSEIAMTRSRHLLQLLSASMISRPDIYPMDEGSIAVDFRARDGSGGVLLLVDQDGSGVMFHRSAKTRGRVRVDDATRLIDKDAASKLKRLGIR